MNLDFNFLDKKQIDSRKLSFLSNEKNYAHPTDFSILLGVQIGSDKDSTDMLCSWWTKSGNYADALALGVSYKNMPYYYFTYERYVGARPCIALSNLPIIVDGEELVFGEYPQTVVDKKYAVKLEKAYKKNELMKTGKQYVTDSIEVKDTTTPFTPVPHAEYEYEGKKYIRFESNKNGKGNILSDGTKVKAKKVFWILVEPIVWLVDKEHDIALSKKVLFSGIQIAKHNSKISSFKRSVIKKFLDNYFSKEIVADIHFESNIIDSTILEPVNISEKFEVEEDINNEDSIENIIRDIYDLIKGTSNEYEYLMKMSQIADEYNIKLVEAEMDGIITTDEVISYTKDKLNVLKKELSK